MATRRVHGQVRRSQLITTWGPGAPIDLPEHAGLVGGLETWPTPAAELAIREPRLAGKIEAMTGFRGVRLCAPPPDGRAGPGGAGGAGLAVPAVVPGAGAA
jgi:hypothetical protein